MKKNNRNKTVGDLLRDARKYEEKAKNIRAELIKRQSDFATRYTQDFLRPGSYIDGYSLNQIHFETVAVMVKIVEFLRDYNVTDPAKCIKGREILEEIGIPVWKTYIFNSSGTISPIRAGVVKGGYRGYYIQDIEKARLWLKYMKELVNI